MSGMQSGGMRLATKIKAMSTGAQVYCRDIWLSQY